MVIFLESKPSDLSNALFILIVWLIKNFKVSYFYPKLYER